MTRRSLLSDRSGATAIMTGLLLVMALGFVGMGIDFGAAYTARRSAQSAADSAAYSAAVAGAAGVAPANTPAQAKAVTAGYGLVDGAGGVLVTVNTPPVAGAFAGHAEATEVVISRPMPRFFAGLINASSGPIQARAVAAVQPGGNGDGCVVAFDPRDAASVLLNGNPTVNLDGCAIWVNSSDPGALAMNGSATVTATAANVVGGFFHNGNTHLNAKLNTGVKPLTDPYADVQVPSYPPGKCDASNATVNGNKTQTFTPLNGQPFVFCNGLTLNGGANVTFQPGVYVIDGGSLIFNGNTTVRGTGVTFVLTNHTGSNIATATINGGADVNLSAPINGPTSGLVFYQDRRASTGDHDILNGGSTQTFKGALYFPRQQLVFNGGTQVNAGGCTQILAYEITFNGNARLADQCDGAGVRGIGGFRVALVE